MKNRYELGGGHIVGLFITNHTYYLLDVWVAPEDRRHGIARGLMRQVCEDADAEGIILVLECVPDLKVIDQQSLENFYAEFGFAYGGNRIDMRRVPVAPAGTIG